MQDVKEKPKIIPRLLENTGVQTVLERDGNVTGSGFCKLGLRDMCDKHLEMPCSS